MVEEATYDPAPRRAESPAREGADVLLDLEALLAAARDDEAYELLRSTRLARGPEQGPGVLGAAWMASTLDDEPAARGYLQRQASLGDPLSLGEVVELRLVARAGKGSRPLGEVVARAANALTKCAAPSLRALIAAQIAAAQSSVRDVDAAEQLLAGVDRPGLDFIARVALDVEQALAHVAASRPGADKEMVAVLDLLERQGMARYHGRTLLRYARLLADGATVARDDVAALYGRAARALRGASTWRDRLELHAGFHQQGRRAFDRTATAEHRARIEFLEETRGALAGAVAQYRLLPTFASSSSPDEPGALSGSEVRMASAMRTHERACSNLVTDYQLLIAETDRARAQEHRASLRLAATLDTLRDAVVACDGEGTIVAANAAAGVLAGRQSLEGRKLVEVAELAGLAEIVRTGKRTDAVVVPLTTATVVVTGRPTDELDGLKGYVVTMVELEQAKKFAQRVSAVRTRYSFADVLGASPEIRAAVEIAQRAAASDANVLVTGESGTGKEVLAQAIHSASERANAPFVGVNCAAVPRDLLEAELFGYEGGAFTGARADGQVGKLELAARGTMLLDEIGDMPVAMQAKLLRVLQERQLWRVGGTRERPVTARFIATTHCDLAKQIEVGTFRLDLFYRLRVLAIELPPLRARREDVEILATHFLGVHASQQRKAARSIAPAVLEALRRHEWPGNIRELSNVMEAEVSLLRPDAEALERLQSNNLQPTAGASPPPPRRRSSQTVLPLAEVERQSFLHALAASNGSVAKASRALGVSKNTLYAKLRAWGLRPDGLPDSR